METRTILKQLRENHHMTQDQMAERLMVTRQAVSRWENGETQPNTDTLRLLSKEFNVSINTLLGSPRQLICQCCGMPLEDAIIGRNKDGSLNEDYCQWCSEDQARSYMKQMLPTLDYWKRYEDLSDGGQFEAFKKQLIEEINALNIEGMPKVEALNALVGKFVNLEYCLPNGTKVKFLDDQTTYLGNQLESEIVEGLCFGVLANMDFILVSTYEKDGKNPELILYKKR